MEDDDADHSVTALVVAAAEGDSGAWNELVDRYTPLLVAVIRRFRLTPSEVEDVAQTVWLRLVEHLDSLRNPQALPGWIVTTARRESMRHLSTENRSTPHDPLQPGWPTRATEAMSPDQDLLRAERHHALLAGMAELPTRQRTLLLLLVEDPPLSYVEISRRTGIPMGSIGPTRGRALDRLRSTRPIAAHLSGPHELNQVGGGRRDAATMG